MHTNLDRQAVASCSLYTKQNKKQERVMKKSRESTSRLCTVLSSGPLRLLGVGGEIEMRAPSGVEPLTRGYAVSYLHTSNPTNTI